jgi:hypothetical protein
MMLARENVQPSRDPDQASSESVNAASLTEGSQSLDTTTDDRPLDQATKAYSCFSRREKWGIISLISLASIFS